MSSDLMRLLQVCDADDPVSVRNRALLLFLFFTAMRRDEVASTRIGNILWRPNGYLVDVLKSKTDQEGSGAKVGVHARPTGPCSATALKAWMQLLPPTPANPLFCHINAVTGEMHYDKPMGHNRIYRVVKETCAAAGLDSEKRLAPHAFRAGFLTQGAVDGIEIERLQRHARHSNINTTARYIRQGELLADDCATARVSLN